MSENKENSNCKFRNTTIFSSTFVLLFYNSIIILSFWKPKGVLLTIDIVLNALIKHDAFSQVSVCKIQQMSWFWLNQCAAQPARMIRLFVIRFITLMKNYPRIWQNFTVSLDLVPQSTLLVWENEYICGVSGSCCRTIL